MFNQAPSFNQNIGSWDVSNCESFVSASMDISVMMYESTEEVTHDCFCLFVLFQYPPGNRKIPRTGEGPERGQKSKNTTAK